MKAAHNNIITPIADVKATHCHLGQNGLFEGVYDDLLKLRPVEVNPPLPNVT